MEETRSASSREEEAYALAELLLQNYKWEGKLFLEIWDKMRVSDWEGF